MTVHLDHGDGRTKAPILTIGHSTRPIGEFIGMIHANHADMVVDVRTIPRSRHNPQFDQTRLARSLKAAGLDYLHLPGLGGLRHAHADSVNLGWRNASFRGYADYMQTDEFSRNIAELIRLAEHRRVVVMCAEAVPWRCHRALIADALLVRGICTEDIMGATRRHVHALTPFARVHGLTITYPAAVSAGTATTAAGRGRKRHPVGMAAPVASPGRSRQRR